MSKILVVAHSSGHGGAETALKNLLINLRDLGHEPTVLMPSESGSFADWCRCENYPGLILPMHQALPSVSAAFLQVSTQGLEIISKKLVENNFEIIITNTSVIVHGARLAELLNIPHLIWIHELVHDNSEVRSHGLPSAEYLRLLSKTADHLLCCSSAVKELLLDYKIDTPASVLFPFSEMPNSMKKLVPNIQGRIDLLVIGVQSVRKNPIFALTILQALRLRGHDAVIHFIGSSSTQTSRLNSTVKQRGLEKFVFFHGIVSDPYALATGRVINLIGATSEPFGLTIPESLALGIPVVSTRSGGPSELLDSDCLYEIEDLDSCVRIIEKVANNYYYYHVNSYNKYKNLKSFWSRESQKKIINEALINSSEMFNKYGRAECKYFGEGLSNSINLKFFPDSFFENNISIAANVEISKIKSYIDVEKNMPGGAVMGDCIKYDVVPFGISSNMDTLYKNGIGFAVELISTHFNDDRKLMSSFIISRLLFESKDKKIRILALGDGIGIDSMRLAAMGFDVDYIDYDKSLTSRIARLNFDNFTKMAPSTAGKIRVITDPSLEPQYDVVVCLEVIEHVSNPFDFINMISKNMKNSGLLFISECFDGIKNHWPTHIFSNEKYSGLLPLMALQYNLIIDDINTFPYAKPYVFIKNEKNMNFNITEKLINNGKILQGILGSQIKLAY